jgi:hypothetical protein
VNAAPNNECRKLLLKKVTSTFRTSSSGRIAAKAPSNMATHTYIPGVNNLKFTKKCFIPLPSLYKSMSHKDTNFDQRMNNK